MAPPMRLRPRSVAEEHLYMELHPCSCGVHQLHERPHQVRRDGAELVSVFRGACVGCATPREFVFVLPPEPPPPGLDLGGDDASTLITPDQFLTLAEAAVARGTPRALARAQACLAEVLKFIPPGEATVPAGAFRSAEGARQRLADPDRFSRGSLEARLAALRARTVGSDHP
ncbi:MAG: hypothetical protein IT370_03775 [Deltaproteobacteria bacterium]|nr:hypothetical protein [Deltaproteobacteria bacterium]